LSARAGIIVAILLGAGLYFGVQALLFPWSLSITGGPVLVGKWYGEVLTPTGVKQQIALDLIGETERCTPPCNRLDVSAELCDARGQHRYEGLGDTDNWRGTRFHVSVSPMASDFAVPRSIGVDGTWQGDVIRAFATLGPMRPPTTHRAEATITESDPSAGSTTSFRMPVTLRRGSDRDFQLACRRLSS
jgi:hypothetical protein